MILSRFIKYPYRSYTYHKVILQWMHGMQCKAIHTSAASPCMISVLHLQKIQFLEIPPTIPALEWLLPHVNLHVPLQVSGVREISFTVLAVLRPLPEFAGIQSESMREASSNIPLWDTIGKLTVPQKTENSSHNNRGMVSPLCVLVGILSRLLCWQISFYSGSSATVIRRWVSANVLSGYPLS